MLWFHVQDFDYILDLTFLPSLLYAHPLSSKIVFIHMPMFFLSNLYQEVRQNHSTAR